mmetsp:Transcript_94955/g.307136  ORF Transcript_94955/g.307136 Transcript_94955/m.307136 type:complete len:356 (-) Transcript_94955:21-1088(-)
MVPSRAGVTATGAPDAAAVAAMEAAAAALEAYGGDDKNWRSCRAPNGCDDGTLVPYALHERRGAGGPCTLLRRHFPALPAEHIDRAEDNSAYLELEDAIYEGLDHKAFPEPLPEPAAELDIGIQMMLADEPEPAWGPQWVHGRAQQLHEWEVLSPTMAWMQRDMACAAINSQRQWQNTPEVAAVSAACVAHWNLGLRERDREGGCTAAPPTPSGRLIRPDFACTQALKTKLGSQVGGRLRHSPRPGSARRSPSFSTLASPPRPASARPRPSSAGRACSVASHVTRSPVWQQRFAQTQHATPRATRGSIPQGRTPRCARPSSATGSYNSFHTKVGADRRAGLLSQKLAVVIPGLRK